MGSFGGTTFNSSLFGGTTFAQPAIAIANPQRLGYIYDHVRSLLVGTPTDTSVFYNSILQPYFDIAYTELWQCMATVQVPRIKREFYWALQGYTTVLDPATIPVTDVEEPELMWERQNVLSIPISQTSATMPIDVTTAFPHGLGTNAEVEIVGVGNTQAPIGRWFITVTGPSDFTLNGSATDGMIGVGGFVMTAGSARFTQVTCVDNIPEDRQINAKLLDYQWEDGVFRFRGATSPTQIKVTYWASAIAPQNPDALLNIGQCQPYLIHRVAGLAAAGKGWNSRAGELNMSALGPKGEADGSGGLLRGFLSYQVQGLQRTMHRRKPYGFNDNGWNWPIYGSASQNQ